MQCTAEVQTDIYIYTVKEKASQILDPTYDGEGTAPRTSWTDVRRLMTQTGSGTLVATPFFPKGEKFGRGMMLMVEE